MKAKIIFAVLLAGIFAGMMAIELPQVNVPQINVSITGYVLQAGNYYVNPTDRLSDLLEKSMQEEPKLMTEQFTEPELAKKLNPIPHLRTELEKEAINPEMQALRSVQLMRDGKKTSYDLLAFYRRGDLAQNPVLRDADLVYIGTIKELYSVEGEVGQPVNLEYQAQDSLEDAINFAYGVLPEADLKNVIISRFAADGSLQNIRLNLVDNPALYATLILPKDRILVPKNALYRSKKTVSIYGEIQNPGEYQVDENTTLWQLMELAGGLSAQADISNALMLNKDFNERPDGELLRVFEHSLLDLSPLEYSYLRTMMRQAKGKYSIDFKELFASEGEKDNRILNHHDVIYIPQKMNVVWVSGQVKRPGLLEYKAEQNWKYYISQADGYSSSKVLRNVRILRASSGNWVKARKNLVIEPGDTIFVPDRIDRYMWTDIKDIVTVTASAITILIGVQNLSK